MQKNNKHNKNIHTETNQRNKREALNIQNMKHIIANKLYRHKSFTKKKKKKKNICQSS